MSLTSALCKLLWLHALFDLTDILFCGLRMLFFISITRANEEVNTDPNSSRNASH